MNAIRSTVAFLCLCVIPLARADEPPAATIVWTGAASGQWNNPANWNPGRVPLATDHVAITGTSNFTVTLNVSATIASLALGADSGSVTQTLQFNNNVGLSLGTSSVVRSRGVLVLPNGDGPSISGAGLLEVRGVLDWTGGRLYGSTYIAPGGRAWLRGGNYMRLTSGNNASPAVFTNAGTVTWLGGDRLYAYDNSQIHNRGRWEFAADGLGFDHCCSGAGASFYNSGTLVKTAGTGTSSLESMGLINTGTVAADAGTLELRAGVGSQWQQGGAIAGAGRVLLTGGSAVLSGRTTLNGQWEWASDSLTVSGQGSVGGPVALEWTAGRVAGAFTIDADGRVNLNGSTYMRLSSGANTNPAVLTNHGVIVSYGGNRLLAYDRAQIYNYGQWQIAADGLVLEYCCSGDWPTLHNYGTLTKTNGTGESTISASLTINYGTIAADLGTLKFNASTEWRPASRVAGAGRVLMQNGNANLAGAVTLDGSWQWNNCDVTGTGAITGTVPLLWRNGRLWGTLTVNPGARLDFTGEYYPLINSANPTNPAVLTNLGTVRWVGGYQLYGGYGAQIYNYGQWRLEGDGTVLDFSGGGAWLTFHNYGTITKTLGTGDAIFINSHTDNRGTVNAASGTVRFSSSSEWRDGGQITGAGRVLMANGGATLSGTTTLFGSWQWNNADIYGTGAIAGTVPLLWRNGRLWGCLTVNPGARLDFSGEFYPLLNSADVANPAVLTNRGTVTWPGGYQLYGGYGAQIYNYGQWRLEGDGTALDYSGGGAALTFHNLGTLLKAGGAGETVLQTSMAINHGTVSAGVGVLRFSSGSRWEDGQITGSGTVRLQGGEATLAGTTTLHGAWEWNNANIYGTGVISGPEPLVWRHGRVLGNVTIASGSRLHLNGEFYPYLSSGNGAVPATLTNLGTVIWLGGYALYASDNAQIENAGEWRLEGGGTAFDYTGGGAAGTFRNLGTLVKASPATATLQNMNFENSGSVRAEAGQFTLNVSPVNRGEFHFPLRGPVAGTDYGTLRVANTWTLQGTLRAEAVNGFTPASGHTFDLVTGNNLLGNFSTLTLPPLAPGLGWTVDYYPTVARLRVTDACLAEGLVGWWPGEGGAGDVTSQHPGTLANGTGFTTGLVNQAFTFDGVDDYVNLGGWNPGTRWTLQAWVKLSQLQTGRRAILGANADSRDWSLTAYDGSLGLTYKPLSGSTESLTNATVAQTNTWYHLAGTFDGSNVALYVNGVLVGTAPAASDYLGSSSGTRIGGSVCCGEYFAGAVDEATIHNRPLSASEIATVFSQGAAGRCAGLGLGVLVFAPGGLVTSNVSQFTVRFNQPIRTNTFTVADLAVTGPGGAISTASFSIVPDSSFDGRTFAINLPPLTQEGTYTVSVGPDIETSAGQNMTGGVFTASFTIDKTGPRIIAFTPSSPVSNQVTSLQATFTEAISAASAQPADVTITGPNAPSVVSVTALASNVIRFNLDRPLNQGSNSIVVGPDITDLAGNQMDQNNNGTPGEAGVDAFGAGVLVETPDLAPHSLIAPALALAGQAANLVYTVTNGGTAPAPGGWAAQFWMALDANGSNATFLGSAIVTSTIPVASSLTLTQGLVLPQGVAGVRYFGVGLDSANVVLEQNETNNFAWAQTGTTVSAPDLVVSNLVVDSSAMLGSSVTVRWTRLNAGTAATFVAGDDRVFLSASASTISGARLLATVPGAILNAGESIGRTQSVTIPLETALPAGNYFIVVAVDSPDAQPESNEGNNLGAAAITLTQPPLPDLAFAEFDPPVRLFPGAAMPFNWAVTNQGSLDVTNGTWRERVSFSNGVVGLVTLAEFDVTNTLAAGQSIARTQQIVFPPEFPADPGFLLVAVDYFDQIVELSESNNLRWTDVPVPVVPNLRLTFSSDTLIEGTNVVIGTVRRNGDNTSPLTVTLSNNLPARLVMSNEVTIAAGTESVTFAIALPDNSFIDGTMFAQIGASATDYIGALDVLRLVDESRRALTLTLATNRVLEGLTVAATISRGIVETQDLTVYIGVTDPLSATVPFSVTIPAGAASAPFLVLATDDTAFNGTRTNVVRVGATGLDDALAELAIVDDDMPAVSLELSPASVAENAGAQAANLTVRLSAAAPRNVVVDLVSSDSARARVPVQVSVTAGQLAASAPVSVIDNLQLGSNAPVEFQGFVHESGSTRQIAATPIVALQILDDESPALRVTLDRDLVAEGLAPAANGTVTRNGSTASSLVVSLMSSDTTEATVSASVTIPAGATSAPFAVNSLDDGTTDGSQRATITASAMGYTSGSADLTVSDQDLPDLRVASVVGPTTALAEDNFTMSYRIENQGRVAATSNLLTKVYLRTDPLAFGGTVVGTYTLPGELPPGQFFEQSLSGRFPRNLGTYYLVVQTDTDGRNVETLENNNTLVSAPIQVGAPWTATVQTPVTTAVAGTPIPMTGAATRPGGAPVPNTVVSIHVVVNGMKRTIGALTDGSGNFSAAFTPFATEAGNYTIAAGHPGVEFLAPQDSFTLLGMRIDPVSSSRHIIEGQIATGTLNVFNLSSVPLSGLSASVVSEPPGWNTQLALTNNALPGDGSNVLHFVVTPNASGLGTIIVRVTSAEGASVDAPLEVAVEPLLAKLVATPASLFSGMLRGEQTIVKFDLVNAGGAATGPIAVSLPAIPWLSLASPNPLPPLAPGESNIVTLILSPDTNVDLIAYDGALLVNAASAGAPNHSINVPFQFRALSVAKGDLVVKVVDELTYYAVLPDGQGAPLVTNATVTVSDAVTHTTITNLNTGTNGTVTFPGLMEGFYEVQVEADQHQSFRGNTYVAAGRTNEFEVFVSRSLVEYVWTVVPTEIEDRTRIVIETVFETVVPLPVVTMEPAFIDLSELPDGESQIEVRISNHGLIAAPNVRLELPTEGGVTFESLVTELGTLPANSSVTVPIIIRQPVEEEVEGGGLRVEGALSTLNAQPSTPKSGSTRDRCYYYIRERHTLKCGPRENVYYTTTALRDPRATGCGGVASGSGSGGGGGTIFNGGPLAAYGTTSGPGGGGVYVAPRTIAQKDKCGCEDFVPSCWEIGGSVGLPEVSAFGGKANLKASGSFKRCTCCDEDGEGTKDETSASIEGSVEFSIAPPNSKVKARFSSGGYEFEGEIGLGGLELKLAPKATGQYSATEDCHGKNKKTCSSLSVDGTAELVSTYGPKLKVSQNGMELGEVQAQATVSIKSGVSLKTVECNDGTPPVTSFCILPVVASAGITVGGTLRNGIQVGGGATISEELTAEHCVSGDGAKSGAGTLSEQFAEAVREALTRALEAKGIKAPPLPPGPAPVPASTGIAVPKAGGGGICARVRLRIEQDLVMARNAFDATLELINRDPANGLSDIGVTVQVFDVEGNDVTDRFGQRPPSVTGLGAVDGTGALAANSSGRASFILVPTSEAAPEGPTVYFVGGSLGYTLEGRRVLIPLTAAPITVYPDPRLRIKYFHERDVFADDPFTRDIIEPSLPYNLAVMVQNRGKGEAKKVRIISGQPQIIENDRGLLIDFEIIGTEVAGQAVSPSLTADFGLIPPGGIAIGRWLMKSTLQGLFIDYKATFEHLDSLGKTNLSLVDEVTIHEMIRLVRAGGAFEDGKPDFLVNDDYDPDDLPDHIYLSDGTTNPVSVLRIASYDAAPTAGDLTVSLFADMPAGWGYLRVPDPANGRFQLLRVVRSDGQEIPVETNAWVTDRTFIGRTERPIRENILHLLDYNSTGTYTLYYGPLPADDFTTPASSVAALPPYSNPEIPVSWSGADAGGGTIAFYDIYVAVNRGPFLPWLQNVTELGAIYSGQPGYRYEFYSIATDNSGNREPAPIYADTETVIALSNNAPSLSLNAPAEVDEGTVLVITANASDPEMPGQSLLFTLQAGPPGATINPNTGRIQWTTAEGNGPSTNVFRVVARDNGLPPLSATSSVSVVVREVNTAPVLSPIADRSISEGFLLRITNVVSDGDLPANTLAFSLGAGAPFGSSINATSGVFQWRPNETQGGTTNPISVIVTDSGAPPLSATQRFNVIARDTLGDFRLALGGTNVYRGQTSSVPVRLTSGIELTNIRFAVEQPITALTNFNIVPSSPDVGSATLTPESANRSAIVLVPSAGQSLQGDQALASLRFAARSNGPSVILPLLMKDLEARKLDGSLVANPGAFDGRVVVVGAEPVLEGRHTGDGTRRISFYGNVGVSYEIQSSVALMSAPWQAVTNVQVTTPLMEVVVPPAGSNTFYRAVRLGP